jgi:hypothetical protein
MRMLPSYSLLLFLILEQFTFSAWGDVCEGLKNGGFESGSNEWVVTSSGSPVISQSALSARTGTWFAWFGGQLFVPLMQTIEQTVTIPEGRAELSYYLRIPEASTDEADFLAVSVDDTELTYFTVADATAFNSGYQKITHNLIDFADGAPHIIRFECWVSGAPVTSFRVDDISLNLCPAPKREELFLYANRWRGTGYGIVALNGFLKELKELDKQVGQAPPYFPAF